MTDHDKERAQAHADALFPEEVDAGTDDPLAQAEAILADSDARQSDRTDPPGQPVEHRRSEDTVELHLRVDRSEEPRE